MLAPYRARIAYACWGILFGLCFPAGATALELAQRGLPLTWGAIVAVQSAESLLWMIDTAPLFLGLFALLGGWRQDLLRAAKGLLEAEHACLEQRVAERTRELELSLEAQRVALVERTQLLETIDALAVPALPLLDGVLLLPLYGALDGPRLDSIGKHVLGTLGRERGSVLMVDLTGATARDDSAADGLLRLIAAARLMGARTMLVGLRPKFARQLSDAGLGQHGLSSSPTLHQALDLILRQQISPDAR